MSYRHVALLAVTTALVTPGIASAQSLDFSVYRNTVEPIFLLKRAGYTRCAVCHHPVANNALRLERIPADGASYTEEQSRKNFQTVSKLVVAGKPEDSHLLMYPLVPEEGGAAYHSGGRQWPSKKDPHWQAIARWINGQK